jgi:undecaprenyl pyrophosphate phosphatase UppP
MKVLLPAAILGTTLGLFILLPISSTQDVTLVESIFGRFGHQKEKSVK